MTSESDTADDALIATRRELEALRQELAAARAALQAQAEQGARLWNLFNLSSEGMLWVSPESRILQANPAAGRIFRREVAEMIGQRWFELSDAHLRADGSTAAPDEIRAFIQSARAAPITDFVMGLRRAGRDDVWISLTTAPVFDAAGAHQYTLASFRDVTEKVLAEQARAQVEEALRQSEGQLRLLFDTMSEGLLLINAEGAVAAANPAAARILGAPREQLIGAFDAAAQFELLRPDGSPYPHAEFTAQYAEAPSRAVRDVVIGLRRAEGKVAWLNLSVAPLTGERGAFAGVVVVINAVTARVEAERELRQHRDQLESQVNARTLALRLANARLTSEISERQRLEEDARRRERFLRQVLDAAPALIMVKDRQGRYVLVNQGAAEAYNIPIAEIEGRTLGEIGAAHHWNMADVQRYEAADQALLRGEIEQHISDLPATRRDGSRRLFQLTKLPLRLNADSADPGEIEYLLTIGVDITAIHESEARYRTLFETSTDAIRIEAPDGRILDCNAAACALYGYTKEELTKLNTRDLMTPETRERIFGPLARPSREGFAGEFEDRRKDGSTFPNEVVLRPVTIHGESRFVVYVRDITARKRAERALRESELRYRTLVEASTDAIRIETLDGRILDCNAATCALYGYTKEELLATNARKLLTPETLKRLRDYQSALEAGGFRAEFEDRRKDGSTFPCEVTTRPVTLQGERCTVVYVRDITARKRAEADLRDSELRYRTLFETSTDAIRITTMGGRILDCNAAACALYGYTKEEMLNLDSRDLVTPETLRRLRDYESRRWTGGFSGEFEDRRKDGSAFPCEVNIKTVELRGEPCQVIYVRDITARKRAEAAILESEERYRTLFETSTDAILIEALDGRVLDCNAAACALYGYSKDEFTALNAADLMTAETRARVAGLAEQREREGFTGEFEDRRKDGSTFPNEVSVRPVAIGGERCVVVYIRDLTERRRLEDQLRQAQKMEAVGRLAGGIAHDFNNLLTVINGYSEMMLRGLPPSDPLRAELTEVHQAGERAADLTRRLLAFSRQQAVEPKVLRLNQVLDEMSKMLQRIIGEEIRLTTSLAPNLGRIRADRGQIEQLIINLCVNARDAIQERTREGGVVSIRTANVTRGPGDVSPYLQAPAGRYVRLSVSDTGVGVAPEAAPRLFEPFYTTKEVGKGTGLGLAVVYGVVRDCGGAIEVESAPGQGATFHIDLPLVEETPAEGATGRARPHLPGGDETILIVEDQPDVRRLLASLLRRLGYTVIEAAGGAEALAACARPDLPIRLVITDVVMPEMSGPQFVARLRRARPDLRLLYISGYADDALRGQFDGQPLAPGEEAAPPEIELIHKPFHFETLAAQVRRALG